MDVVGVICVRATVVESGGEEAVGLVPACEVYLDLSCDCLGVTEEEGFDVVAVEVGG